MTAPDEPRTNRAAGCPDGGACHHLCGERTCFRVLYCGPFSDVSADGHWPREMLEAELKRGTGTGSDDPYRL